MKIEDLAGDGAALALLAALLSEKPDPGAIRDGASWKRIQEAARRYGVSALAAYAARPYASPEQRVWCDGILKRNWLRHDQSLQHLQSILEILDKAGIPSLVLKGPLLARRHYQPPFLRKSSIDVDLAIRKRDIPLACRALSKLGYTPGNSLEQAVSYCHDVTLLHEVQPRIELHFRLSHGATGIPVEEFFGRAVPVALPNGATAMVLSDADELLHLVLHFAHHRFPLLFNLYELRRICGRAPAAARREAIERATQHHFRGAFLMTDVAMQTIWGERLLAADECVPKTWLGGRINEKLYRQCVAWSAPGFRLTLANRIRGRWLDIQMTDYPSDAFRFFGILGSVAWHRLRHQGWRTLRYRHFLAE